MHRTSLLSATLLALFAARTGLAQDAKDKRVDWLAKNTVKLRTIDPEDDDFGDLDGLAKLIGDARIVQLGEQTHRDGATFRAKVRLVRFLHERMGFDVLAFESGLYSCNEAWRAMREDPGDDGPGSDRAAKDAAALGVQPIWAESMQCAALWKYLVRRAKSKRPLVFCGFDCQVTGKAAPNLGQDLAYAVERAAPKLDTAKDIQYVHTLIEKLRQGSGKVANWESDGKKIDAAFAKLRGALEGGSDTKKAFWLQLLRSLRAYIESRSTEPKLEGLAGRFNPRDAQMADNLLWLANERFKGRKIIVWAATMHVQRNPELIDTRNKQLSYYQVEPMGHLVSKKLGKAVFTVGFSTYAGRTGSPFASETHRVERASPNSLEALCVGAGLDAAIVPFRNLPKEHWLDRPLVSRPLGNSEMSAIWPDVLDAMCFIRRMTPSTPWVPAYEAKRQRDFIGALRADAFRFGRRADAGHAFADKGDFGETWDNWTALIGPDDAKMAHVEKQVRDLAKQARSNKALAWRYEALLSRIAESRGDSDIAITRAMAALRRYPKKQYRDPAKQSAFQHLVNACAMLIASRDGEAKAMEFVGKRYARDAQFVVVHDAPWKSRLGPLGRARLLTELVNAAKKRKRRFREHERRIDREISRLRGSLGPKR